MKIKLCKSVLAFGLATLASVVVPTSYAAPSTVIGYDSEAAGLRCNLLFAANDAAANTCYNELLSSSTPAALAGFYTFERNSFADYYSNVGVQLFNYYYFLSYADIANLAIYARAAADSRSYYQSIAQDYVSAYDDTANSGANALTSVASWGGNIDDAIALGAYFVDHVDDVTLEVESAIGANFAGSYYQYAVIYRSVADAIYNTYYSAGQLAYYNYFKLGQGPAGLAVWNEYTEDGFNESLVYYAYESYYRNLTTALE